MTTSIIRPDENGDADDVAITDVTMFRLERMSGKGWWGAAYRGDQRFSFWLSSKSKITITYEDELGCVDDSDEVAAIIATEAFKPSESHEDWVREGWSDAPITFVEMANRLKEIGNPSEDPCKPLPFDPDDFPVK